MSNVARDLLRGAIDLHIHAAPDIVPRLVLSHGSHLAFDRVNLGIRQDFFEKVDGLVQPALGLGLNVMINIHHFDEFTSNPAKLAPKFYAIWRQIAEHYADAPEGLAFELLNEPKDAATVRETGCATFTKRE